MTETADRGGWPWRAPGRTGQAVSTETAQPGHEHEFGVQPPEGTWVHPGPCRWCGLTWAQEQIRQAEEGLRAARELAGLPPAPDAGTVDRVLTIIRDVDEWLDAEVAAGYGDQPLGQDWARVAKVAEEAGEAIADLIAVTGQNPRKGVCGTLDDLLGELGDVAVTGMFAIQHFTKDETRTAAVVMGALEKAAKRAAEAGYGN